MNVQLIFIGRAEPLVELFQAVGLHSFAAADIPPGTGRGYVVPGIGDHVRLRLHQGPDIRDFRCTGRRFDFSATAAPVLQVELDLA